MADVYKRQEQGCLSFEHTFTGEQEHSIRLHRGEETAPFLRTSVYSLEEDLFRRRPYLGDFHLHSCYSDGVETPEFVAAMYRQEGYDFMCLTDHGRMDSSRRAISFYEGLPLDFKIHPGEEVHSPGNPVHILNFGGDFSVDVYKRQDIHITLQAPAYIHAVGLDGAYDFEDNFFPLTPGERRTIALRATGEGDSKDIMVRCL